MRSVGEYLLTATDTPVPVRVYFRVDFIFHLMKFQRRYQINTIIVIKFAKVLKHSKY